MLPALPLENKSMENPYQAPLEGHRESTGQVRSFGGRLSVLFAALIFGAVSVLSTAGFMFNLARKYPGTDELVIVYDPLWMLGHVLRAVGLGLLTYFLLRYHSAVKMCRGMTWKDAQGIIVIHDKLWLTAALVLAALAVYSFVYAAFSRLST